MTHPPRPRRLIPGFFLALTACASTPSNPSPPAPPTAPQHGGSQGAQPLASWPQWEAAFVKDAALPRCQGEGWKVHHRAGTVVKKECLDPEATHPFVAQRLVAMVVDDTLVSVQAIVKVATMEEGNGEATATHDAFLAQPGCAFVQMDESPQKTRTMAYYTCGTLDAVWVLVHTSRASVLSVMAMPKGLEETPLPWLSEPHTAPLGATSHRPLPYPAPEEAAADAFGRMMYRPMAKLGDFCPVPWEEGLGEQGMPIHTCTPKSNKTSIFDTLTAQVLEGKVIGVTATLQGRPADELEAFLDQAQADATQHRGCTLSQEVSQPSFLTRLYTCPHATTMIHATETTVSVSRLPLPESALGVALGDRMQELAFKHQVRELDRFVQSARAVIKSRAKTLERLEKEGS